MHLYLLNDAVDLIKNGHIARDTPLVAAREYVVIIVCELFPAHSADHVVRTRLRFFKSHFFLVGQQLFGLLL